MENGRKPTAEFELVTPNQARRWLGKNERNRHLRQAVVERLASAMREDRWKYNPDGIALREDGVLENGQHRLSAIVEVDSPQWLLVVKGLPAASKINIDTGLKRQFGDYLAMERGETYSATLAAIVNFVWRWRNLQPSLAAQGGNTQATPDQLLTLFEESPAEFRDAAHRASIWKPIPLPPSMKGGLFFLFASMDYEDAVEFFERVNNGADLTTGDPILILRNQLFSAQASNRKLPGRVTTAWVLKAWNAFRKAQTITLLRYRAEESYPVPL